MSAEPSRTDAKRASNRMVAAVCVAFFAGMVGAAYASVPLYRIFCQVTGFDGTTQRVDHYADRVLDRKMTVRFDTNVGPGLAWEFKPVVRDVTMKIGETAEAHFTVKNLFDTPSKGRASFNVVPETAGIFFNKVQCFCFDDTTLKPGETRDMPVVFYIDPDIAGTHELDGVTTITLSYTYFPVADDKPAAQAASTGSANQTTGG